jgi:hypothetical protein
LYEPVGYDGGTEKRETVHITKGNFIIGLEECGISSCEFIDTEDLSIVFKRPSSDAIFYPPLSSGSEYVKIIISTLTNKTAFIRIYPSGRVQVN